MRLILSSEHPRNSSYSTETGEVLYKIDKPVKITSDVATIRKAVRTVNGVWHGDSNGPSSSPSHGRGNGSGSGAPVFEGHFAVYAQVEFHDFGSTRFRYNGLDVKDSDFFRKQGFSWYGRYVCPLAISGHTHVVLTRVLRDRIFKASDGKDYRWRLRAGTLEVSS